MGTDVHRGWKGLVSNSSPHDVPPGASVEQVNMYCVTPGVLSSRRGVQLLDWPDAPINGDDIISMAKYDTPDDRLVVYQLTGTNPIVFARSTTNSRAPGWGDTGVFQPLCYMRTRKGDLIVVNGVVRGRWWDGLNASTYPHNSGLLGMDPPASAPTIASPAGGSATAGDYDCAYRYLDKYGNPSNLSTVTTHTAAASDKFQWTALSAPSIGTPAPYFRNYQVELYRSTAGQTDTLYLVATLPYYGAITSSASNGAGTPKVRFTLPTGHGLTTGMRIAVTGHTVPGYITTHEITASTATTVDTSIGYTADGTGGEWYIEGYVSDTASDTTLEASTALPILNANGSLHANRFTVPPDTKPFVAMFQDRTFYYGSVLYNAGTVQVSGATATGTNTAWPSGTNSSFIGRRLYLPDETQSYEILTVPSATSLTFSGSTTLSAGTLYTIAPEPSEARYLYWSEPDEPESVPATNAVAIQDNTGDHSFETGLMPYAGYLYLLHERHLFQLSFVQQPDIDIGVQLVAYRGCINNRCWVEADGIAYLMDQQGCYRFTGGVPQHISAPIDNYWRDGTIDFSVSKWFHCEYEPTEKIVRWYVSFTADSTTRPKRALCYNTLLQQWHTEKYIWEIGGSCRTVISGRIRQVVGADTENLYLVSEGTTDGVSAAVSGTVTASGSTTLTDSGASFATTAVGAPVAVVSGTGKWQIRRITARSSTQLTVDPAWTTNPAVGDRYVIGAIECSFKTGLHTIQESENATMRSVRLCYQPVTNATTIDVRRYLNHDTSPANWAMSYTTGDGVTYTTGDPNAVVNLQSTQYAVGTAPGFAIVPYDDGQADHGAADRWVAIECRGYAGRDRIELYYMVLTGVQ